MRNSSIWFECIAMAAGTLLAFLLFAVLPPVDIWVSALFFDAAAGEFWINGRPFPELLRHAIWTLSIIAVLVCLFAIARRVVWRKDTFGVPGRIWGYVLLLYALAPGFLVDGVLKRFWGRARPAQITEFGGSAAFSLPHQMTENCARNCSFVSGEVAGTVALMIAVLVVLPRMRPRPPLYSFWISVSVILPVVCAYQRIAAGRHFLTDALFAVLFVGICARLLWHLTMPASKAP